MKSRLSLIFAALVVLLGAMVWVVQDRRPAAPASRILEAAAPQALPLAPVIVALPPAPLVVAPENAVVESPLAAVKPLPSVHIEPSGAVRYIARPGDTLSEVAIALLGSDSKDHRDAVAAVNVSLQSNPDRVVAGQAYSIDTSPADASDAADDAVPASDRAAVAAAATGPRLKYVARSGDTVAVLAGNLLGGDTQLNREAIIAANESLWEYPNHLIAGQSYTIVAPVGMTSDPDAPQAKSPTAASGAIDADDAVAQSSTRVLRYTAKPGDTVSKLAVALLGSDTPANRDLIIESNPSLTRDPNHLVAGRTYWISAPIAE